MKYIGWILLAVVVVAGIWVLSGYNGIVTKDQAVAQKWSEVQNQYQRRSDLVPNLVETVKGAAAFEQETFTAVTEARTKAQASSMTTDPANLTPEKIAEYQAAQGELGSALSRLLLVVENYPELKATENFRDLQAQLEGTENRIAVARRDFTLSVQDFNSLIKRFPGNILASLFGFGEKGYFEAEAGADVAPTVDF
jgi:LemA protein